MDPQDDGRCYSSVGPTGLAGGSLLLNKIRHVLLVLGGLIACSSISCFHPSSGPGGKEKAAIIDTFERRHSEEWAGFYKQHPKDDGHEPIPDTQFKTQAELDTFCDVRASSRRVSLCSSSSIYRQPHS